MDMKLLNASETLIDPFTKIKAKGIYNVEDLYVELFYWFQHYGFAWREVEYKKVSMGGGKERHEMAWVATKKMDDYTSMRIQLVLAVDMQDVEVTIDNGKKVTRQKATLEFRTGLFLDNKTHIWKGKPLGKLQQKVYEIMTKDRYEQHEGDAFGEAQKLYSELKAFMMLYKR